jgi:D-lactate dehydrogenase
MITYRKRYNMIKIVFFDTKEYDKKSFEEFNKNYGYEITYLESKLNSETAPLARGFDVICIFVSDVVDKKTIEILKECGVKLIALRCAGFNNVDMANMDDSIKVVRVPAYSPYAVAEHAVALLLDLNRKIYKAYQRTKKYNFSLNGLLGFDINGKTVGVVGTGKIGKVFIKIMNGFGAKVLAYDVYQDKIAEKELGFKYVDLDELYSKSDIISFHCPLTEENNKMINYEAIEKMKDGIVIINTSRGKLIDTESLIKRLSEGKIGGVGLDVYEDEEEFFLNDLSNSYLRDKDLSILLSMPNVVITSHQAFFTKEALDKIATDTCKNIQDIFEKGYSENEVKK